MPEVGEARSAEPTEDVTLLHVLYKYLSKYIF